MKRIKKIMALWMVLVMAFSLAACGTKPAATTTTTTAPATTTPAAEEGKYELALITDIGTIDDKSFNQGAWEGLKKYAEEKGITHKYYKPTEKSTDAYVAAIDLAVQGGAKLIVTPGFLFEPAIYKSTGRPSRRQLYSPGWRSPPWRLQYPHRKECLLSILC